jgi:RNA polymerase sigma-B factor
VSATLPQLSNDVVLDVRPGDHAATTKVEGWLQAYATSRDPQPRERIILAHLGLADRVAGRFRHSRGTTPEDLTQTARAGLIAAIDRYDPAKGSAFVPFAVACVVGDLKRHLRDSSWRLRVPRPLKERALRLCSAGDELLQRLGRSPTTSELAEHLEMGEEEVLEGLAAAASRREVSLDQPAGDERDLRLGDLVAAPEAREGPEDLLALPAWCRHCPSWNARSSCCGSSKNWTRTPSRPGSASPRCTSPACSAAPWPACVPSWWNPDQQGAMVMQAMWMVMVTLALGLSGVLGLALATHVATRTRRR